MTPSSAARPRALGRSAVAAVILAYLVPGAGHLYLGRRNRAVLFLAIVAVTASAGCLLSGELFQPASGQPLVTLRALASMGMGLLYWVLRYGVGYAGDIDSPGFDYGGAFLLTAGLMNLLLIMDVWDIAQGEKD